MRNELICILGSDNPDPAKVASLCEDAVNALCYNASATAREIFACDCKIVQDRFLQLSVAFIKTLACFYASNVYDQRNLAACRIAEAITNIADLTDLLSATNWVPDLTCSCDLEWEYKHQKELDFGGKCVINMLRMHRTLQQQFAATCFSYISRSMTAEQIDAIEKASGVFDWNGALSLI